MDAKMLFLAKKTKVKTRDAYRLLDMGQLKAARGTKVIFSWDEVSLEDQLLLSDKYLLCPNMVKWGPGRRICGQEIRPGKGRCGMCPKSIPLYSGPPIYPKMAICKTVQVNIAPTPFAEEGVALVEAQKQRIKTLTEELDALKAQFVEAVGKLDEQSKKMTAMQQELDDAIAQVSIAAMVNRVWDSSFNAKTIQNSKTCLKRVALVCGMSFQDDAKVMVNRIKGDVVGFYKALVKRGQDIPNTLSKARRVLVVMGEEGVAAKLQAIQNKHMPKTTIIVQQQLDEGELEAISIFAEHLGVDLSQRSPGRALLGALRQND